jgi:hypothetical protein
MHVDLLLQLNAHETVTPSEAIPAVSPTTKRRRVAEEQM